MLIKELSVSDESQIIQLFNHKSEVFKNIFSPTSVLGYQYILDHLINRPEHLVVVGAYIDGELEGMLSAFRWEKMPYYTVRGLRTKNKNGSLKKYISLFDSLLTAILKKMESEGRFDFYFVNLQRNFHKEYLKKNGKQRKIPHYFKFVERYDLSIQEIVRPHEASKYFAFQQMMDFQTFDGPTWIRRGSLKEEHRNIYFKSHLL